MGFVKMLEVGKLKILFTDMSVISRIITTVINYKKPLQTMASLTQTRVFSAEQQANFAVNSDPAQGISLCIPRVFNNIGWRRIKQHMIEANLGYVERVDVIPVKGGAHKRAYVHFAANRWNMRDPQARAALKALQEGKRIKLEYESPWYWLAGISGGKRPAEAPKPRERKVKIEVVSKGDIAEAKTVPVEEKTTYDLSSQPDSEMRDMNDPIQARAAAGNPSEYNMAVALGADPADVETFEFPAED